MLISNIRTRIGVRPSFFLLLTFIFYLDDRNESVLTILFAATLHELGHIAVCLAMKGRVEMITLSAVGAELKMDYPAMISYGRENLMLLAGAGANLALGAAAFFFGAYQLTYVSVGLGIFNLLPVAPLDGGRVLYNLIAERFEVVTAERAIMIFSGIFTGILAGIGAVWAIEFANWIPAIISGWLLANIVRKKSFFS